MLRRLCTRTGPAAGHAVRGSTTVTHISSSRSCYLRFISSGVIYISGVNQLGRSAMTARSTSGLRYQHTDTTPHTTAPSEPTSTETIPTTTTNSTSTLNELPISLLLSRLLDSSLSSEGRTISPRWSPDQVRKIVCHILHAYQLLPSPLAETFLPTVRVTPPTQPLSESDWETLLTATSRGKDIETFDLCWGLMMQRRAQSSKDSSPFTPTPVMFLCRMTMLSELGRFQEVETVFQEWQRLRRSRNDPTQPNSPTLLGYHILLQSYLNQLQPESARKCLSVWKDMKQLSQPTEFLAMDDNPDTKKQTAATTTHLQPTDDTFHILLRALLDNIRSAPTSNALTAINYSLQQLSPLLLDMEHQYHLEPNWVTLLLSLDILQQALDRTKEIDKKETPQVRNQRLAIRKEAWEKAQQLWKTIQSRSERLTKAKKELEEQGKGAKKHLTSSLVTNSNLIPSSIWWSYLETSLAAESSSAVFATVDTMLDLGLLPLPPHCERILSLSRTIGERDLPPPTLFGDATQQESQMDGWRQKLMALKIDQDKAADMCLKMLRCLQTHAKREEARRQSISQSTASDTTTPTPSSTASPALQPTHYLTVFSVLSSVYRFDEFTGLWRHFQAEYQHCNQKERFELGKVMLNSLLQSTLRLEALEASVEEAEETNESTIVPADATILAWSMVQFFAQSDALKQRLHAASISHSNNKQTSATANDSSSEGAAKDSSSSATNTSPTTSASATSTTVEEPTEDEIITDLSSGSMDELILTSVDRSTRLLLLRSLVASGLTNEFELLLRILKHSM